MSTALADRGAVSRGVFSLAVLTSLVVLFAPSGDVPAAPPGVDKVVHLVVFAALGFTGRWAGIRARPLAVLLAGYAGLSEIIQAATALARSGSVADVVADLAGAGVGLVAWSALRRETAAGSLDR